MHSAFTFRLKVCRHRCYLSIVPAEFGCGTTKVQAAVEHSLQEFPGNVDYASPKSLLLILSSHEGLMVKTLSTLSIPPTVSAMFLSLYVIFQTVAVMFVALSVRIWWIRFNLFSCTVVHCWTQASKTIIPNWWALLRGSHWKWNLQAIIFSTK